MKTVGFIKEIWRYPVSALAGEQLDQASVSPTGLSGDRCFALVDARTMEVARPERDKHWQKAIFIKTRTGPTGLEVMVPGCPWLKPGDPQLRANLTQFVGFDADIWLQDGEHNGASVSHRYNVAPLHLVTTASLRHLKVFYPAAQADVRRFRANVVVSTEASATGFLEFEWIGHGLHLGEVQALVSSATKRCGFTTIAQDGVVEDPDILRTIVRHGAKNFGIYAAPLQDGTIKVGDAVVFTRKSEGPA